MTQVSRAVGMMERQELAMEDVLFTQGDAGDHMYVIIDGNFDCEVVGAADARAEADGGDRGRVGGFDGG